MPPAKPVELRLLDHIRIDPSTGCWRWTAYHDGGGYARVAVGRSTASAHRMAYECWVGPIPSGLHVDHVRARGCVHRDCINPAHLEVVTQAENNRRITSDATRCRNGHEYTPETLARTSPSRAGTRTCRECRRAQQLRPTPCPDCGKVILRCNLPKHRRTQHAGGEP